MEKSKNGFLNSLTLYQLPLLSKIAFLSQLKIFSSKHEDFLYNEQKFDGYAQHWKDLKAKHFARLTEGGCKVELSPYYTSTIVGLERVADHLLNVSYSIISPTGSQEN